MCDGGPRHGQHRRRPQPYGEWTRLLTVTLAVSATDSLSGVDQVCLSESDTTCSSWEGYDGSETVFEHTLSGGDDLKTVYVWVEDLAGNQTIGWDTIELDTTPPPLTVDQPVDGEVCIATVTALGSSELSATIEVHVAPSGEYTLVPELASAAWSAILADALDSGANTVTITATDLALNTCVVTRVVTRTVMLVDDVLSPTVPVMIPQPSPAMQFCWRTRTG